MEVQVAEIEIGRKYVLKEDIVLVAQEQDTCDGTYKFRFHEHEGLCWAWLFPNMVTECKTKLSDLPEGSVIVCPDCGPFPHIRTTDGWTYLYTTDRGDVGWSYHHKDYFDDMPTDEYEIKYVPTEH